MKKLVFHGAAALCALGIGTAQAQDLRFTVWSGNQAHLEMLNGIADAYAQEHPQVSVTFDVIPFGEYVQKITIQLAGGTPPDLGWLLETSAPAFIEAGVLQDVGPALRGDPQYDFADFSQGAMGLWVTGDSVFGVPFSTSPFLTYFNRDMVEAAGLTPPDVLAEQGEWTWDALRVAAGAVAETAAPGVWGFESVDGQGYGDRVWHTLIPIIRAHGGRAWSGTTCELDSAEAVAAVQLYHDMIFDDGSAVPPGEQGDFFSGQAGLTVTQLSRVSKLEGVDFAWGIAPLPDDVSVIGQAAVVAFAQSRNPELAADFLRFMTDQHNVATMAAFFPPARVSVLGSEAFLQANAMVSPEQMRIVGSGIERGTILPSHTDFPRIQATARPILDRLWQPDADVGAILADVCDAIEPIL